MNRSDETRAGLRPFGLTGVKEMLRARIRALRNGFKPEWVQDCSVAVADRLYKLPQFAKARTVSCYLAMPCEVQTAAIMAHCWQAGKRLCVPAFDEGAGDYRMALFGKDTATWPGRYGIAEPKDPQWVPADELDVVLVPAVAFDRECRRIGHGGGHYDRILAHCKAYKVGLAFEVQVVDEIPAEAHDRRVDVVLTERAIYPSA